jgi:hypothetical protein
MTSHAMQPIDLLAEYGGDGNPVIVQTFTPGKGWTRTSWRKRASRSWLRKLRRDEGITTVAVEFDGGRRVADFRISELV